jgi:hypothetical protein
MGVRNISFTPYPKKWVGFTLVEMENDLTRDQEANFSEDKSGAPPSDDDSS